MKYSSAFDDLSAIIANTGLSLWPGNVVPKNPPLPHGVVHIIPSGSGVNFSSVSGVIIIDIYAEAGRGPTDVLGFADTLDTSLVKRTHERTQFFTSSLQPVPSPDPTRVKWEYTVTFKHFGGQ